MEEKNINEAISIITEIKQNSEKIFNNSIFHIIWGTTISIGCFATIILQHLFFSHYIILLWAVISSVSSLISIFAGFKLHKSTGVKTIIDKFEEALYGALYILAPIMIILAFLSKISFPAALGMIAFLRFMTNFSTSAPRKNILIIILSAGWFITAFLIIFVPAAILWIMAFAMIILDLIPGIFWYVKNRR